MMQLSDTALRVLNDALAEFARATRFPLAFGGFIDSGVANMTAFFGHRTPSLLGLEVKTGLGLGGRVMEESRPRLTPDYATSRYITHDYDNQVIGEGVKALFAMPVVVNGSVRAVLYGGTRGGTPPGMAFLKAGATVSSELAQELRVEEEVVRRLALNARVQARASANAAEAGRAPLSSALREELRSSHAELRRIAARVDDSALRGELLALERRLAGLGAVDAGAGKAASDTVHADAEATVSSTSARRDSKSEQPVAERLTPREIDVLTFVALGGTNAEIARNLALKESTVKSYLNTAMSKLGASTRHAAVVEARRASLIP